MKYDKKFYEKHGMKITNEPMVYHSHKELENIADYFHERVSRSTTVSLATVAELEGYVRRYPDVPSLKNYLYVAYIRTKQIKKGLDFLNKTMELHPNYIFANINFANYLLQQNNPTKAASALKEPFDVRNFEKDEYIHCSAFTHYYTTAVRIEIERGNFDEADKMNRLLFDYDPKDEVLRELVVLLATKRLIKNTAKKPNYKEVIAISKPIKGHYLSDDLGKPIFNHPEIHQLYQHSLEKIPKKVIQTILLLPRQTIIQDLEHAMMDAVLRFEDFQEDEWDDRTNNFFVHALFFLTELRAYESVPTILNFLRQDEEFRDYWIADSLESHFNPTLYILANNQLELLKSFVLEENVSPWHRMLATEVAAQVALKQPERRKEVLAWFDDVIQYHLDNPKNANIIDTEFLSSVVGDLLNIGATELENKIRKLYDKGWVDDSFSGNLAVITEDLHKPINPFYNNPLPVDIYELYSKEYEKRVDRSQVKLDPEILNLMKDPYFKFQTDVLTKLMSKAEQNQSGYDDREDDWQPQLPIKRDEPKVGRNDPCPCGSGKKYKKCHGN